MYRTPPEVNGKIGARAGRDTDADGRCETASRQQVLRGAAGAARRDAGHRRTASSRCSSARRAAESPRCCAAIAGLESISSGVISIGGRDVSQLAPSERDVAMVFQSYALYPAHDGAREHGFRHEGQQLRRPMTAPRRVAEAARILQLEPYLDRKPGQLSGRPAPARRHRTGHREAAQGVPVRRAAVEPRRQAACADAGRA